MELREFIVLSLAEITAGISEGRLKVGDQLVAPDMLLGKVPGWHSVLVGSRYYHVQNVEFDVAVTVSKTSEGKTSLGIAMLGIGADAAVQSEQNAVSRVKFTIPLALPPSKN